MTPSQPTDDRSRNISLAGLSLATLPVAIMRSIQPRAPHQIVSAVPLSPAHSSLHLRRIADHLLRLRRATLLHSHTAAKSP